jgi:hypothetical protein
VPAQRYTSILDCYFDPGGRPREVVVQPGRAGSLLVVDRDATTLGDRRLVAHLAADEPRTNAVVVCCDYLRNPDRWCRSVTREDLEGTPIANSQLDHAGGQQADETGGLVDRDGCIYRLAPVPRAASIPELRWQRLPTAGSSDGRPKTLCVRSVIGALESYQPIRALTERALASPGKDRDISVSTLRGELERMNSSHIVLNRGLREAVLAAVGKQGLTMSEITLRCGRCKRDARGNRSGDTSWLARRIGLSAEGGRRRPTPWVHSDVLALVARQGLGISPREVELG